MFLFIQFKLVFQLLYTTLNEKSSINHDNSTFYTNRWTEKDDIWKHYRDVPDVGLMKTNRVKCRLCDKEVVRLVARLKAHYNLCKNSENRQILSDNSDTDESLTPSTSTSNRKFLIHFFMYNIYDGLHTFPLTI